MNDSDRQLLLAVSGCCITPRTIFSFRRARLRNCAICCPWSGRARCGSSSGRRSKGLSRLREEHVAIFDMDSKCSLSLAWHRYGDDPRLGARWRA